MQKNVLKLNIPKHPVERQIFDFTDPILLISSNYYFKIFLNKVIKKISIEITGKNFKFL